MKVLRSTLVAAVAFVAAACGDKVTVAAPPTSDTTPSVTSVTVTPSSVTLNIGQSVTFTAVVDVKNGAATTVTWSSSSAAVTVTAAGAATAASATPGAAVCATSTADANKKGCATAIVSAAPQTIPATVSIQSITTNAGGLNAPINPANVAGIIDVRANVSPGTEVVNRVEVLVGTTVADAQTFSASQSAALRFAADEAQANQSAFPPILFSINTAAFTQNATTGAITTRWANGAQSISVKLYVNGTTSARSTATYASSLTFNNLDTYVATLATTGTTANALNAGGFRYDRGGLAITVSPVIYSGGTVAAGTVTFGSAGCDASTTGARTVALVAPVAPSANWTATFSATAAAGAGNVNGYEFSTAGTVGTPTTCTTTGVAGGTSLNPIGETITVTATNGAGDALFAAATPANANAAFGTVAAAVSLRLDNRAPSAPTLVANPNGRANGWFNASVGLVGTNTSATSNNVTVNGAAAGGSAPCVAAAIQDCGVGTTTRFARIAASAAGTVAEAIAATASSAPALPAPSVTNTTYCGVWTTQDALGNEAALPAAATVCTAPPAAAFTAVGAQHMRFGVDIAAPTATYCGATVVAPCVATSIIANARISGATIGGEFRVTVNDTGLVGNSGMLPTSPVLMLLSRRAAGTTPNSAGTTTLLAADGATVVTALSATAVAAAAPNYSTAITAITGAANHAYWTHSSRASDAAGNTTDPTPRVMVYDNTGPVAGSPSAPATLTATGFSASAFLSEDLDIQDYSFGTNYGAIGPFTSATAQLQMPVVAVSGYNAATFANTNFGVTAAVPLPLALQANVAAGLTNVAAINTTARAQSNLSATSANFVPGIVTPGTAISTTNFTTFGPVTLPAAVTGLVTGNTTAATAAQPSSAVFTATLVGATAVFNNPFSRIDFYMKDATGTRYFNVGTASAASLNDNGVTRTFTFTATVSGATVYNLLGGAGATFASDIVALGVGAANGNIAMVNSAVTAINVVF